MHSSLESYLVLTLYFFLLLLCTFKLIKHSAPDMIFNMFLQIEPKTLVLCLFKKIILRNVPLERREDLLMAHVDFDYYFSFYSFFKAFALNMIQFGRSPVRILP